MRKYRIWLSPPHMGGSERLYVEEAFASNWIAPVGPQITQFENDLSALLHGVPCVALCSGTAAIHLALILLHVKAGDEVICPTLTFAGTCNPVMYLGAQPVFVDAEPLTWNMDPDLLELAIADRTQITGRKPKAIIVVHLYGMPANMDRIMRIAAHYEIPVIEDAAEALGSMYNGKYTGTLTDVGILSFNGNKIITTSGGGALLSRNDAWVRKARFLATQARDPAPHYEHSEIGYNYRISNVCAAIGRGQLEVLSDRVKRRREIFDTYFNRLKDCVNFQKEPKDCYSNRWLSTIYTDASAEILKILDIHDIEARPVWKPMHLQPVFREAPAYISGVSEDIFKKGLCLPSGSALSCDEQDEIIELIRKAMD
jgi:dTDP-4-amino-4,6-dideoxygalactose transaminase